MSKINSTDIIFATLTRLGGKVLANLRLSGVENMKDILRCLRGALPEGSLAGLVTVSVRNCSAGWQHTSRIMIR